MTHTIRTVGLAVALVAALLATLVTTATPAQAHNGIDRWKAYTGMHDSFERATEGRSFNGGSSCAPDIGSLSTTARTKICSLKVMGAWSGTNFRPYDDATRYELAKGWRKLAQYANNNYAAYTDYTNTNPHFTGFGHDWCYDVPNSGVAYDKDAGVGYARYFGMMPGINQQPGEDQCFPKKHQHGTNTSGAWLAWKQKWEVWVD